MIYGNTGYSVKKRRLKKNIDIDNTSDAQMEEEAAQSLQKETRKYSRSNITQRQPRVNEEGLEIEQIDTSIDKRVKLIRPRDTYESHIDQDRAAAARQIFANPDELQERVVAAQGRAGRGERDEDLESMFDGNEIDDQLASKQDKAMAELDIPERL